MGRIVNMASVAGTLGGFGQASYSTTKAGSSVYRRHSRSRALAADHRQRDRSRHHRDRGVRFRQPGDEQADDPTDCVAPTGKPMTPTRSRSCAPTSPGTGVELNVSGGIEPSRFENVGGDRRRHRPAGRGGRGWDVSVSLAGSGAQCLAVDPSDPDTAFAGLREQGLSERETPARRGRTPSCRSRASSRSRSPPPTARSMPAASRAASSAATTAEIRGARSTRCSSFLPPNSELPAEALDVTRPLIAPSPHNADLLLVGIEPRRPHALDRRRRELVADHRPGAQPDVHSLAWHPREPGRAYEAGGVDVAWSDDGGENWHPADDGRDRTTRGPWRPTRPIPTSGLERQHRAIRRPRRARRAGADLPARGRAALGGGRDPGLAMPYALADRTTVSSRRSRTAAFSRAESGASSTSAATGTSVLHALAAAA